MDYLSDTSTSHIGELESGARRAHLAERVAHVNELRASIHLAPLHHLRHASSDAALTKLRRAAYANGVTDLDPADSLILLACAVDASAARQPVFAHATAAAIWGLPMIGKPPERVEYLAAADSHGRAPQVRRRRTSIGTEHVRIGDLQVTTCERTVVDHARYSPLVSAIAMCDSAVRYGATTRRKLIAELESLPKGARGRRMAMLAVHLADPLAESVLESLSRARMFQLGMPRPQLQTEFTDARGFVARVDFYWPRLGLVGEADGRLKYAVPEGSSGQEAVDSLLREKQRELRLRRCAEVRDVLRWTWDDAIAPARLFDVMTSGGIRPVLDGGWTVPDGPLPHTAFLEPRRRNSVPSSPSGAQTHRAG